MSNYTKDYLNRNKKRSSSSNMDKKAIARKQKMLKMKRKYAKLAEKERNSIEEKKKKMRRKLAKNREKANRKSSRMHDRKNFDNSKIEKQKPNKKKNKTRKISKPKTILNARLTEPKKRSLLRRVMLQMKYNRGSFDYIEKEYDDLTRQEIEGYRKSDDRIDRKYYKEVQQYEDAVDDVTVRKGWLAFKVGLATLMLISSIGLYNHTIQQIHDSAPEPAVMVTLAEATEEQKDIALTDINLVINDSEYNFENLTEEEQIDAALRIPFVESKIGLGRFKNYLMNFKDQELLDEIVEEAFGEEYSTFADGKKEDLRKLAYELLEGEKKEWTRDPVVIKELQEKQEAERKEREANRAEVERRLNGTTQNDQELDDMDDR